jgi:hypothetical protein
MQILRLSNMHTRCPSWTDVLYRTSPSTKTNSTCAFFSPTFRVRDTSCPVPHQILLGAFTDGSRRGHRTCRLPPWQRNSLYQGLDLSSKRPVMISRLIAIDNDMRVVGKSRGTSSIVNRVGLEPTHGMGFHLKKSRNPRPVLAE